MNISYNWLKQYVDFDWGPEELGDRLTMSGLEVEGIHTFESIPGGLKGVVVGHVLEATQHPNADRLRLCKVDVGGEDPLSIVCGAPNVAQGQKVPVGLVGTTLHPVEGEPFTLKKSKIRGELSMGMICAEDELGLGQGHDGIIVLDPDTKIGTPASEVFNIEIDHVIEIGLTANRADAASHIGVARDIAALLGKEIKFPQGADLQNSPENHFSIELPEPDKCPRYAGIYIKGIEVKESPEWLQNRLKAIDLRPINNIVDITNYVLHEYGQPLHAFDADRIAGNSIVVKTMDSDQKFTTLDDKERDILAAKDLMICDAERPVALGGVMGGQNSEVDDTTKNVFLESAYFYPAGIRATANRFGLKTDASYRFERGVDPNITAIAAKRATQLILELAGGEASQIKDVQLHDFPPFEIDYKIDHGNILMGHAFTEAEVRDILERLDIQVEKASEAGILKLKVPQYRVDVLRPQDVMEEILRIYGYNNVALPSSVRISLDHQKADSSYALRQKYLDYLAASGYHEIIANPLVPAKFAGDKTVNLINNLSEELAVLRDNLLFTGLDAVAYNHNRSNYDLRLVEYGKSYHLDGDKYQEKDWMGYFITGNKNPLHWSQNAEKVTYFTLSREIEKLQSWFGFEGEIQDLDQHPHWDYGMQLLANGKVIARYGKVNAEIADEKGIKTDVFFGVADWNALVKLHGKKKLRFSEIPKFPSIKRDISMIVKEEVSFSAIANLVKSCNPKLIREVNITDVYRGDNVEKGHKSYLINLTLRDDNKTLTDKAADKLMKHIFGKLEKQLDISIRK